MSATYPIVNPDAELAYLAPDIAHQYQVFRYVVVGTSAVMIWDFLSHMVEDIKILRKPSLPTITFILARLATLAHCLTMLVLHTVPINDCQLVVNIVTCLWPFTIGLTCFMLFLRLRAVFLHSRIIVGIFFVLWLAVVATNSAIALSVRSVHIEPTNYCIQEAVKLSDYSGGILNAVFDTLSFVAVSIQLMRNSYNESDLVGRARTFALGDGLPAFSKMLLRDGQLYFCVSSLLSLAQLINLSQTSHAIPYRLLLSLPVAVVGNIMVSKIFRRTKLGFAKKQAQKSFSISTISFARSNAKRKNGKQMEDAAKVTVGSVSDCESGIYSLDELESKAKSTPV